MDYILRHGQTEANADGEFRGWGNWPLTPLGRAQAHAAGLRLKNRGIKRIVSSDLPRAKETAEIVGKHLGLPVSTDSDLRPLNVKKFTGKDKKEYWPEFQHYLDNPDEKIPGGESINEFRSRNQAALKSLLSGDHTLIVTHTSNITDAHGGRPEDDHIVEPGGIIACDGNQSKPLVGGSLYRAVYEARKGKVS